MKLTKKAVQGLQKTGKRYNEFDDDLKGFAVRVGAGGDKSFYLVYRAGKGRGALVKWLHLGKFPTVTVDQARQLAKSKAATVALGGDPAKDVRDDKAAVSTDEALTAFQEEHFSKLKPRTVELYEGIVRNHLRPKFGKMQARKIVYSDIARFHTMMKTMPYMANRCVAVMSIFLEWCEKHGYREKATNPCREIKLYKEHKRQDFLSVSELADIGEALTRMENAWQERKRGVPTITPETAAAIRLLLFTGARKLEILSLRWDHIDMALGMARLPDSKTGFKVLQLPAPALAILDGLPRISPFVFPSTSKTGHVVNIKKPWAAVLKASGLEGWRIHDLRHAFASAMVNSGASLPFVGKILGHTQASTTQRYAHLEQNPARGAAENAAAKIAEAMQEAGTYQ